MVRLIKNLTKKCNKKSNVWILGVQNSDGSCICIVTESGPNMYYNAKLMLAMIWESEINKPCYEKKFRFFMCTCHSGKSSF